MKESPEADFSAKETTGCVPLTMAFDDLSSGPVTSWWWEFGDGGTSSDSKPTYTYSFPGLYPVTLTVTGDCGSDSEIKQAYIHADQVDVIADFTADSTTGCAPLKVNFSDSSVGPIDTWLWEFGDGKTSPLKHPSHTYPDSGDYTVRLTVSGQCGSDSETKQSYLSFVSGGVVADFTANDTRDCDPLTVTFTDLSLGDITSWLWDFGDGGNSGDSNPTHTYHTPGDYTVSLIVSGQCGPDAEIKVGYIKVVPFGVGADFTAAPTTGCAPLTVAFTDLSTGVITSRVWRFGDGWTDINPSPTHTYTRPGLYTVTLKVAGNCGSDSRTKVDYINVLPCQVDLVIEKDGLPTIIPGQPMIYQINFDNRGDSPASGVIIRDTLPAGVTYLSSLPFSPADTNGGILTYQIGTLPPWSYGYLEIAVLVNSDAQGVLLNIAEIQGDDPDTEAENNQDVWATEVIPPVVDLVIGKWSLDNELAAGDDLVYRVAYNNFGTDEAA